MEKDTLVLTFGRISIVTIGHMKLFKKIDSLAKETNSDALLCLSKSFDNIKNPINFNDKSNFIQEYIDEAGLDILVETPDMFERNKSIYQILPEIYRQGEYKNIIFVCGSDRIPEFKRIEDYNGKEMKNEADYFNFDSVIVVNAGERDEMSDDITSRASGTLMRKFVKDNDLDSFLEMTPDGGKNIKLGTEMFNTAKENLD